MQDNDYFNDYLFVLNILLFVGIFEMDLNKVDITIIANNTIFF